MKFLLISPFTSGSGSAIRFWNIAQALVEAGHEVVYSDRKASGVPDLHRCEKVRYAQCPSVGSKPFDILFSLIFFTLLFIRHINCSVYYALKPAPNNCIPALIAKLLGKRILLDVDDLDYAYLSPGKGRQLFRFFFDRFPRFFHLVTFHTPNLGRYLSETAFVSQERLYYFAQGISPDFINEPLPDPAGVIPQSCIYIATLGITSDFGLLIPELAVLCEKFPECSITVVGDGCRRGEFEQSVDKLGIAAQVTFKGTIDHSKLPYLLARHQVGINYMQPAPVNSYRAILKIREYLACGLQVVCNDVGDVDLFAAYVHIRPTLKDMFEKVEELFRHGVGQSLDGRRFVEEEYGWSTLTNQFLERLEQR